MKLRIRDFQALIDATLVVSGITLLTGKNNQGKSATTRALYSSVAGRAGGDHVRHGAEIAMVGVELEKEPDHKAVQLAWIKGDKGAEYYIDGDKFTKLGRKGVPVEDLEKHGFKEVEFSGGKHYLNFVGQDEPHFLVSLPPSQVFDYVSKILQEREVLPVLKVMSNDVKELGSEARLLEGQIQTRKQSVADWTTQRELLAPALHRTAEMARLQEGVARLRKMREVRDEAAEIRGKVKTIKTTLSDLDRVITPAERVISALETKIPALAKMKATRDEVQEVQTRTLRLETSIANLEKATSAEDQLLDVESEVLALGRMIRHREEALGVQREIDETQKRLAKVEAALESFPDLDRAEALARTLEKERGVLAKMASTRDGLLRIKQQISSAEEKIEEADEELARAELGFDQIKTEIGVCPTCGSEMEGCL